jgi:hypothetical protein
MADLAGVSLSDDLYVFRVYVNPPIWPTVTD